MDITQGYRIAAASCDNEIIKNSLLKGLPLIKEGKSLKDAFIISGMFSHKILSMIAVGEESGSIEAILEKISLYSEKETGLIIGIVLTVIPVFVYLAVAGYIAYRIISFYSNYFSQILM